MKLNLHINKISKVITIKAILAIALLIIAIIVGSYLRLQPVFIAKRYGHRPTLYEMDPYITYWVTEKLVKFGLGYFWQLTSDNELTHIFWYPNGRDFTKSELPLTSFIAAITYPITSVLLGIDLYTWVVYLPVFLAILSFIGVFLIVYEFTKEPVAAGLSALVLAILFVDRQIAGFTVKYSTGLALLTFYIWLHIRAFSKRSKITALLAGIILGLSTWAWAGYNLTFSAALIHIALIPLMRKVEKEDLVLWSLEVIPPILFTSVMPFYHGIYYTTRSAGILFPASLALLALAFLYYKYLSSPRVAYLATAIALAGGGILALLSRVIVLKGKALAAMGLIHETPVIVGTVAEYQPTNLSSLTLSIGPAFIMAILALAYLIIYEVLIKKNSLALFPIALFIIATYATVNIAYFTSYLTIITSLCAGILIALLLKILKVTEHRFFVSSGMWFRKILAVILLMIFIPITIVYSAGIPPLTYGSHYNAYRIIYPTLLNSGLPYVAYIPAWYDALTWINKNTPEDSVIVAWWDYGYWISVLGKRASVADGSTLNLTQIRILAQALTLPEEKAANLLINKLKIPKDKLYVIVYEVFYVIRKEGSIVVYPVNVADAAKAIAAIIRIAHDDPKLIEEDLKRNVVHQLTIKIQGQPLAKPLSCGVGTYVTNCSYSYAKFSLELAPNWNSTSIKDALLFKIMIHGVYTIWPESVFAQIDALDVSLMQIGNRHVYILNQGNTITVSKPEMKFFKPAYISVSKIGEVRPEEGLTGMDLYTVVFIYKYVGE